MNKNHYFILDTSTLVCTIMVYCFLSPTISSHIVATTYKEGRRESCTLTTNPKSARKGGVRLICVPIMIRASSVATRIKLSHKDFFKGIEDIFDAECSLGVLKHRKFFGRVNMRRKKEKSENPPCIQKVGNTYHRPVLSPIQSPFVQPRHYFSSVY